MKRAPGFGAAVFFIGSLSLLTLTLIVGSFFYPIDDLELIILPWSVAAAFGGWAG